MSIFVAYTDFVNKFELYLDDENEAKITSYINRYEEQFLIELFGVELYDLAKENFDDESIYQFIAEPFNFQDKYDKIHISRGLKDMLICMIYFMFLQDDQVQMTINSAVKMKSENSEKSTKFDISIYDRYNEGVKTYKAIQSYIIENLTTYPTFKGIKKDYVYMVW